VERRREALFRFDPVNHRYLDLRGNEIPHITGMLKAAGWIDDTWFTEEGSIRGTAVHDLTADFDLGALDADAVVSRYRSWMLGYVEAMKVLKPEWWAVEEPIVHPVYRFGGRPDNIGLVLRRQTVLEKKTGAKKRVTVRGLTLDPVGIQLSLQAILAESRFALPAAQWDRRAIYLKENGKYSIELYDDPRELDEAWRLVKTFGGTTDEAKSDRLAASIDAAHAASRAVVGGRRRQRDRGKGDVFFQRAAAAPKARVRA
jgi:hypothetical protein